MTDSNGNVRRPMLGSKTTARIQHDPVMTVNIQRGRVLYMFLLIFLTCCPTRWFFGAYGRIVQTIVFSENYT